MANIVLRTVTPIIILIALGFFSRRVRILKSGDERVLSAYLYYFALPALLFVNLAETIFTLEVLRFIIAGVVPIVVVLIIYILIYLLFRFNRNILYLIILTTFLGSTAFFGIPFVLFAFPTEEAEQLAILAVVSIAIVSVTLSITVLELYKIGESAIIKGLTKVLKGLSKNPLILSIALGIVVSITGMRLPSFISDPLHMLGQSVAAVGIFMLGVFLYGRKYRNLPRAFLLTLPRMILLPAVALLFIRFFGLTEIQQTTLVLMHSMPIAISLIVLSERYNFYKETIASAILISSLASVVYLSVWLLILR